MRSVDAVGLALVGLGLVLVLAFPLPRHEWWGFYSIADLSRPGVAVLGVLLMIAARLRRG